MKLLWWRCAISLACVDLAHLPLDPHVKGNNNWVNLFPMSLKSRAYRKRICDTFLVSFTLSFCLNVDIYFNISSLLPPFPFSNKDYHTIHKRYKCTRSLPTIKDIASVVNVTPRYIYVGYYVALNDNHTFLQVNKFQGTSKLGIIILWTHHSSNGWTWQRNNLCVCWSDPPCPSLKLLLGGLYSNIKVMKLRKLWARPCFIGCNQSATTGLLWTLKRYL